MGLYARFGTIILAAASVSGCMDGFYNRPVIEDSVKFHKEADGNGQDAVGTLALDASRRVVVVRVIDRPGEPAVGRFCAEPPPSIANEVNSESKSGLDLGDGVTKTVSASMSGSFSTSVVTIPEGSRAIDMMRVGAYALCQYHLNGAIADTQMGQEWERLLKAVMHVADMETRHPPSSPVTVTQPDEKVSAAQ